MDETEALCCGYEREEGDAPGYCGCAPWCACTDCGHAVGEEPKAIVLPVRAVADHDGMVEGEVLVGLRDGAGRDVLLWDMGEYCDDRTAARQTVGDLQTMADALNVSKANAEELAVARKLAQAREAVFGVEEEADRYDYVPPEAKARALNRACDARDTAERAFDAFYAAHPEALAQP